MKKIVLGLELIMFIAVFSGVISVSGADSADWTFMIYMDADNDLEYSAISDFYEMASVGSTVDVNIVVQLDRAEGYSESDGNWTDCKRFYVTSGMTPTLENAVASLGEINMGDPQNLEDFIVWAMGEYPAENYTLILWNHGWLTIVGADFTHGYDGLDASEIYSTLNQVFTITGNKIDIIGISACMGSSIEMAYHVNAGTGIMVASEEVTTSLKGIPYDNVLSELVASPTMNATEFAMVIYDQYVLNNEGHGAEIHTFSVLNTTRIAEVVAPAVNNLAGNLSRILSTHCYEILDAIRAAATGYTTSSWHDLYDFCQVLERSISDNETAEAAQNVMDVLPGAVMAEWHDVNSPFLYGLSIHLPESDDPDYYVTWYAETALQWASDTVWNEFLDALFGVHYPGTLTQESFNEISYTLLDSDSDDYLDTVNVSVDADTTGATSVVTLFGQLINSSGSIVDTANASWTIHGSNEEWGNLNLSVPMGSTEDWCDVELHLYDNYGVLEDHHYTENLTYLPLAMQHDVSVQELLFKRMIVGQGFPAYINVTISNIGHYTEVVNVTTSANGTLIDSRQLILTNGNVTSFTITWDTSTESMGNYTITSIAEPVEGEVSVEDNTWTGGPLFITITGDVEGDCDVDIYDIVLMCGAYGAKEGEENFIPSCDIDGDGDVDIYDVVPACSNYGDSW